MPGQRSGEDNLVQRRGRSHGRGTPDGALRPIARSTPVRRQGKPRTKIRICGEPADQRRITDVPRLRPYRCTIIASITFHGVVERPGWCAAELDMGHQSAERRKQLPRWQGAARTQPGCARLPALRLWRFLIRVRMLPPPAFAPEKLLASSRGRVVVPDGRFPDLPSPRLRAAAAGRQISLRIQDRL